MAAACSTTVPAPSLHSIMQAGRWTCDARALFGDSLPSKTAALRGPRRGNRLARFSKRRPGESRRIAMSRVLVILIALQAGCLPAAPGGGGGTMDPGGGSTPPPQGMPPVVPGPFDINVFQATIQ